MKRLFQGTWETYTELRKNDKDLADLWYNEFQVLSFYSSNLCLTSSLLDFSLNPFFIWNCRLKLSLVHFLFGIASIYHIPNFGGYGMEFVTSHL